MATGRPTYFKWQHG